MQTPPLLIPYGAIATIVFWIIAVRLWIRDGRKIPMIFAALWVGFYLGFQMWPGVGIPFQLVVCFLGIAMLLVEKARSLR
jgi:hypothetical protein